MLFFYDPLFGVMFSSGGERLHTVLVHSVVLVALFDAKFDGVSELIHSSITAVGRVPTN